MFWSSCYLNGRELNPHRPLLQVKVGYFQEESTLSLALNFFIVSEILKLPAPGQTSTTAPQTLKMYATSTAGGFMHSAYFRPEYSWGFLRVKTQHM
jgi:hypothetical protein